MFPLKVLNFILKNFTRTCSSKFHVRIVVKTEFDFFLGILYTEKYELKQLLQFSSAKLRC